MRFHTAGRDDNAPFFLAADRLRPYLYRHALADCRLLWIRGSPTVDMSAYGLHSLRVLGYNLSIDSNGDELTMCHGRWRSSAHKQYKRFKMSDILPMASKMVGSNYSPTEAPAPAVQARTPVRDRTNFSAVRPDANGSDAPLESPPASAPATSPEPVTGRKLPTGWTVVRKTSSVSARTWLEYSGPEGHARSVAEAWRVASALSPVPDPAGPSSVSNSPHLPVVPSPNPSPSPARPPSPQPPRRSSRRDAQPIFVPDPARQERNRRRGNDLFISRGPEVPRSR